MAFGQVDNKSEAERIEISATPAQISISTRRGGEESRNLVLSGKSPVNGLKIVLFDLTRGDDQKVLNATSIRASLGGAQIPANGSISIPVSFDLRTAAGGEYKGEMRVVYEGGNLTIPVNLKIKDRPVWPVITLLIGVAMGIGLTYYRKKGQPRDEALKLAGNLRAQIRTDTELPATFKAQIEGQLIDCEAAIQAGKWDEAKKAVESGIALMNKWRKDRANWLAQIDYQTELIRRIDEIKRLHGESRHLLAIHRKLEDAGRAAPASAGPVEFRNQLDGISRLLNQFLELNGMLEKFVQIISELPSEEADKWRSKGLDWRKRINNLSPEDTDAVKTLSDEISTGISEAEKLIPRPKGATIKGIFRQGEDLITLDLVKPAPEVRAIDELAGEEAARRLRAFKLITAGLSIILLAGVGYHELYQTKPTFGVNGWYDYVSLLAWGFGAEATRAAVTDLIKTWGVS